MIKIKKKYSKKKKPPRWPNSNPPYEVGKDGFEYKDVKKDYGGWSDPNIFHPLPYDVVSLWTTSQRKPGWWTGIQWDGYRLRPGEKVLFWKKEEEKNEKEKTYKSKKSDGGVQRGHVTQWL